MKIYLGFIAAGLFAAYGMYVMLHPEPLQSASPHAQILFGGDMMFDRSIRTTIEQKGGEYVFSCLDPILAPQDLKTGDTIITAEKAPIKPGNRIKLKNIPQGSMVHNIELFPEQGGKIVRSAGGGAMVLANEAGYVQLVMPSSETRMISGESYASIGQLSNSEHNLINLGKAGKSRWLGRRPKVRGTAMNPVDHPYGGGEGKQGRGTRRPKTAQGKITGGRKTRNKKKKSGKFIIRRRSK